MPSPRPTRETAPGACDGIVVEDLAVGDLVVTASGAARPIRWLGHRAVDCRRDAAATRPVRITAHDCGRSAPKVEAGAPI